MSRFLSLFDGYFRHHPRWQALVLHYGVGLTVALQLLEDLWVGYGKIYSGEYFSVCHYANIPGLIGYNYYWWQVAAQVLLLSMFFMRRRLRWVTWPLGLLLLADCLMHFSNHRCLTVIMVFLIALDPVDDSKSSDRQRTYWSLDLVRFQVSAMYLFTAFHKTSYDFLSGQVINNIFFTIQYQHMMHYPDWLFAILQNPQVCQAMACGTVCIEIFLAFGLHFRRCFKFALSMAVLLHVGFAVLIPHIWTFTLLVCTALVSFFPCPAIEESAQAAPERSVKRELVRH